MTLPFTSALLLGLLVSPGVVAAETVHFATIDYAPYSLDDNNDKRGFLVDSNAAISARAGVDIIDNSLPIARLMKNLQQGVSDCAIFLLSPWSQSAFSPVAEVYERFNSIIVTRKGLTITRVDDLHGKLLALPRGSYREFPISTDPNIRKHPTNDYAQSARLLKSGRVDAIAGTALSLFYYLSILQLDSDDIGSILSFDEKPLWLQCARQQLSAELIERLRQSTDSLRQEGVFKQLHDSYVPPGFR